MAHSKLDRLKKISEQPSTVWQEKAMWRQDNADWLFESRKVALIILRALRAKKISKQELAEMMEVTPQYIGKITKGEENLSLATIKKFERILEVPILAIESSVSIYNTKIRNTSTTTIVAAKRGNTVDTTTRHEMKVLIKANQNSSFNYQIC
jgi:transcriptional regulator with XRE-family HTH domain